MSAVEGPNSIERIAAALAAGEFRLYYQPKVNMRSGQVTGVEALLRWRHPERGMTLPGAFIPQIEHHDLIIGIGRWVIDTALNQLAEWRLQGIQLAVSVNVAARQLLHPDFLADLRISLNRHPDISPAQLELEILESAALDNTGQVRGVMEICRDWGMSFALDDFGTGYASLAYLRDIPAETLKIDRSFVTNLLNDSEDLILVEGVVGLAKAFRRVVVAEGVESAEQGLMLMRLGCDIAQGFGIARPMPADDLPAWLAAWRPDPQWKLWADIPWEMEDFPLLVAKYDHATWVRRVLDFLEGDRLQLGQKELTDHHKCRFGHWYDHQGQERYGHLPAFQELDPIHQKVHHLGPEIVRLKQLGEMDEAFLLARELSLTRDHILTLLDDLQRSVAHEPVGLRLYRERPARAGEAVPLKPLAPSPLPLGVRRSSKPTILLVAPDIAADSAIPRELAADYELELLFGPQADLVPRDGPQVLQRIQNQEPPDLILLALRLPGMDGFELCRHLKENPASRQIPIIFLADRDDAAEQTRCFNAGAVDYIGGTREAQVVAARVRNHINLKQRCDLLEAQASIDALTGVPNRRRFDETFRMEWRRAARNLLPLSLLMIDVDHFKAFNDHYGHGAGDECLRQVGRALLEAQLRPGDFVARYGGEEFAVILPGCHGAGAHTIGERIRSLVESLAMPHAHSSVSPHVTLSVGGATMKPAQCSDLSELFLRADAALYRAKQTGRNQVILAG